MYVCDLHFDKNDLVETGAIIRLKSGATPQLRYKRASTYYYLLKQVKL